MKWKTLTFKTHFKLDVPETATFSDDEHSNTLIIKLLHTIPPTEFQVHHFANDKPTVDEKEIEKKVSIFGKYIGETTKLYPDFQLIAKLDETRNMYVLDGVSSWRHENIDYCWLVRGYAEIGKQREFIIHWRGLREDAFDTIHHIFTSFEPV